MEKKEDLKRKRSENWNEDDRVLLKELIRKRVREIENKNTDTHTNHVKKKAWLEVEESFNNLCTGGQRNVTQLKSQWVATKISARKEFAERHKEMKKNDGGLGFPQTPVSSHDISVWLPNEFIVDSNGFDSDATAQESMKHTTSDAEVEVVLEDDIDELEDTVPDNIPRSTTKTKKKISANRSITEQHIKQLTEFDMKCRAELHRHQIDVEKKKLEVEEKRLRNLDHEYDLIEAKIKLYKNNVVWPSGDTKRLVSLYESLIAEVGTDKKFEQNEDMWAEISTYFPDKTAKQCETYLMRILNKSKTGVIKHIRPNSRKVITETTNESVEPSFEINSIYTLKEERIQDEMDMAELKLQTQEMVQRDKTKETINEGIEPTFEINPIYTVKEEIIPDEMDMVKLKSHEEINLHTQEMVEFDAPEEYDETEHLSSIEDFALLERITATEELQATKELEPPKAFAVTEEKQLTINGKSDKSIQEILLEISGKKEKAKERRHREKLEIIKQTQNTFQQIFDRLNK